MSHPQHGAAQCLFPAEDSAIQAGSQDLGPVQASLLEGFSKEETLSRAPQTMHFLARQTTVKMGWESLQASTAEGFPITQESHKWMASKGIHTPASGEALACSAIAWAQ